MTQRILPGFRTGLSLTLTYLAIIVLVPLLACIVRAMSLSWSEFVAAVWTPRTRSAYALTFGASFVAAVLSTGIGTLIAWVLVRYEFYGKRLFDSLVDLPFALPTAVAGLVFSGLYVPSGWIGQFLAPLGIEAAYSRLGIVLVLVFIGFPFVVRAVQPVLETLEKDVEEASACMGASRWQTFRRVILPTLKPAIVTGFALSLARGLGEYGSVVFISGNMPFDTEIAPVLIVAKLEAFAYAEATAIATILLVSSFAMQIAINLLERRTRRGLK